MGVFCFQNEKQIKGFKIVATCPTHLHSAQLGRVKTHEQPTLWHCCPVLGSVSTRWKTCCLWFAFPILHSWPIKSKLLQNYPLKTNLKERRKFLCPQPLGLARFPEGGRKSNLSLQSGIVKKDRLLLKVWLKSSSDRASLGELEFRQSVTSALNQALGWVPEGPRE